MLNEKYTKKYRHTLGPEDVAAYVHVDDGLVMSVGPDSEDPSCNDLMHRVADGWGHVGFVVTERVVAEDDLKVVGYRVQRSPPC